MPRLTPHLMPHLMPQVMLGAYAAATALAEPGLRLLLRRRAARGKEMPERLAERRGLDPGARPAGRLLWLHAASVGEAQSVLPVLTRLDPSLHVLFTTGTVTSARLLAQRLPELGLADRVAHRFAPMDVPRWVRRFLDHWRPDAAAFVEAELWPNLLAGCRARRIPTALVNARMSARSFAGWRRVPGIARPMLGGFACVQARSAADGTRLQQLGARNVTAPGDLKFAADPLPADRPTLAGLRAMLHGHPVWLAASTHPGEEALAARVHSALVSAHPRLVTIVVPRHPERGPPLAAELGAPRRSAGMPPPDAGVWIADTLGELGLFYRLCGIVFMGKSLVGQGGQNPLEPARLGCAVAIGPHAANFADAVAVLAEAGALTVVADEAALAAWVDGMLREPGRRQAAGQAASAAAARLAALPGETAAMLSALPDRTLPDGALLDRA